MAIRDQLRNRTKKGPTVVAVRTPEWEGLDGQVFVASATAKAMDRWYEKAGDGSGRAAYVAQFACDSTGNRHFNDEDASWLGDEPFTVIDRIFQAGMELNRTSPKAQAELTKNSPSGTDGGDLPSS